MQKMVRRPREEPNRLSIVLYTNFIFFGVLHYGSGCKNKIISANIVVTKVGLLNMEVRNYCSLQTFGNKWSASCSTFGTMVFINSCGQKPNIMNITENALRRVRKKY